MWCRESIKAIYQCWREWWARCVLKMRSGRGNRVGVVIRLSLRSGR